MVLNCNLIKDTPLSYIFGNITSRIEAFHGKKMRIDKKLFCSNSIPSFNLSYSIFVNDNINLDNEEESIIPIKIIAFNSPFGINFTKVFH